MKTKYFWMLLVACIIDAQSMSAQSREPGKKPHRRMSVEQMSEMQANKIANNLGLDDKKTARFIYPRTERLVEKEQTRKTKSKAG